MDVTMLITRTRTISAYLVLFAVYALVFVGIGSTLRLPTVMDALGLSPFVAGAWTGIWALCAGSTAEYEFARYRQRRAKREAAARAAE